MRKTILKGFVLGAALFFSLSDMPILADAAPTQKTAFLVLAPDRGFLGNQEIQHLFEDFEKEYPAGLALAGRRYDGVDNEYAVYLKQAIQSLKGRGFSEIVVLPLFLSASDPVLLTVVQHLPAYAAGIPVRFAAAMSESHLTAQILLDQVTEASRHPEQEHVVILGAGALNEADETAMRADLAPLTAYVKAYHPFKTVELGIYYDRSAEAALKEKKNQAVDDLVMQTAAKKGHTIVVPFLIGPKFDTQMSMTRWLSSKFKEFDLSFVDQDILQHPNLLLWLKKTANAYLPASPQQTGVVIMPHGATQPYNDVVEQVIAPLQSAYRIEMAYGMGDPFVIQRAVSRLEAKGVRRIVFVRLYSLSDQMKGLTDYILGLSDSLSDSHSHDEASSPPHQVRSSALFSTFGGYEEDPAVAEILHERVREISREPSNETVILVAHGAGSDEADTKWLEIMGGHADRLRQLSKPAFRAIKTATVREDWPEKRGAAVAKLKDMIQEGKQGGRVLLISNRLYGGGPYEKFLEDAGLKKGADYEMNAQGFAPHPVITRWLAAGIEKALQAFDQGSADRLSAEALKHISAK